MALFGPSRREIELENRLAQIQSSQQKEAREQRRMETFRDFHKDIEVIKEALEPLKQLAERFENLDKMVDGLIAMTKVAADQLDEFKKTVEILARSLAPTEARDYEEYAEESTEGRERVQRQEVREMMRKGIPEKEAQARMRERDIYDQLARSRRQ